LSISKTIYTGLHSDSEEFDINNLITSVLLFDTVLISNPSILPNLVQAIGPEGLLKLLNDNRLSVVGGGPSAQANYDYKSPGFYSNRPLDRPLRFGFETIYVDPNSPKNHSAEERLLIDLKREKEGFSIEESVVNELHAKILHTMQVIDGGTLKYSAEIRDDVQNKQGLFVDLILDSLARDTGFPIHVLNINLSIEEVSEEIFQINTNLGRLLNINDDVLHNYLKKIFFEITGTSLQVQRMKAVNAAAGLTEAQSRIISKRIDYLSRLMAESDPMAKFSRICKIAKTPELTKGASISIDELIELRDSTEAYAFRDWLHNSAELTDVEIEEITSSWNRKIGEMLQGENAKGLRWLATTGAGALIGEFTGTITSGTDFFLDKFFPSMGPIGLVTGKYEKFIRNQESKN